MKHPKVIIVTGRGRACAAEAVFQVLKQSFGTKRIKGLPKLKHALRFSKKDILILEADLAHNKDAKKFSFLVEKSQTPILLVTHLGEIPAEDDFFAADRAKAKPIHELLKVFPERGRLILNFDDETIREVSSLSKAKSFTFGFQKGADFRLSDVRINHGTNFKINYQGNIVPIWLENLFGKEQAYSAAAAAASGAALDMNLVQASQSLKLYKSLPGRTRLIEGNKHSKILDDTAQASPHSTAQALKILDSIKAERKIAVLGDMLGIGKYTSQAHEAIGERAAQVSDLLFTVGARAKFIAQGAETKGFPKEKIFEFDNLDEAGKELERKIEPGDLILVDGSKEMEMQKIVEEIKFSMKHET